MSGTRCSSARAAWLVSFAVWMGCAPADQEPGDALLPGESAAVAQAGSSLLAATQACRGKPGQFQGKSRQTVQVGWDTRQFVYYAPPHLSVNQPVPLVIVPHGFTMSGEEMYNMTGYKELADQEGFVAVFPDGEGPLPWNVGAGVDGWGAVVGATGDDQTFMDEIIEFVAADRCLDRDHVFVSGFSMGGYFTNELGCTRDDIAGIAPHSGGGHDLTSCRETRKPVMLLHGDADWLIYYQNALEMRDRWLKRNGCSPLFHAEAVKGGTCEWYLGCPADGQVVLCHFDGLGHAWAGGNAGTSLFVDPDRESAARLAWEFWKGYAW